MTPAELWRIFCKTQGLLNDRGFQFMYQNAHDKKLSVFRLYQQAAEGRPMRTSDRGVGVVLVPVEPLIAYVFLFEESHHKKVPRPSSEVVEVPLSGTHIKWTNAIQKALMYLDHVEFQSGLQPFDPKDAPSAVYKAVK